MNWVYGQRVLVAVVGVAALTLVACADPGGERAAGQGRAKASQSATGAEKGGERTSPPRIPSAKALPGWAHSLGFASDGSGFALLADCPDGNGEGCKQSVAVLDKGARAWRLAKTSPLPDTAPDWGVSADLVVLGSGRALIREGKTLIDRTWYTADGGRTWTKGTTALKGTVAEVPEDGRLVSACLAMDEEGNNCGRARLAVIMPHLGEYYALAHQPPLAGVVVPVGEAGGALYVEGESRDTGRPTLAVSTDDGITWRESPVPQPATEYSFGFSVVSGGKRTLALQIGQLPEGEAVKNGLVTIHELQADGTWKRVWAYRPGVKPNSMLGALIADDSTLTVYSESGVWVSDTGGRTFREAEAGEEPSGSVRRTPLGWLWSDGYGNGSYRISRDGLHWHSFTLAD
ncbi:exo-alpha-sialidase [Streptomyces sp. TRM66268-LWL]|uniref:Exo-alpha-sialidase n=1 Tax=Streptomyces polyasparticus TaxID=2767826 RepID=A0ABR7SSM6_9ACTN|nr:exo-alpha-sialidase [Streptomyces polyasparticus]MBC9717899.1 exo-alpha-sialidase [Streptomyces polyasparticus]